MKTLKIGLSGPFASVVIAGALFFFFVKKPRTSSKEKQNVAWHEIKWDSTLIETTGNLELFPVDGIWDGRIESAPVVVIVLPEGSQPGDVIPVWGDTIKSEFWSRYQWEVRKERKYYRGKDRWSVTVIPVMQSGGRTILLRGMRIFLREYPSSYSVGGLAWKSSSMLASGEWIKIEVVGEGIYRIPYDSLVAWGVPAGVDPRTIKMYGQRAGQLPYLNSSRPYDDLEEMAIKVVGEEDGLLNSGDYILFYGEDQNRWMYDSIAEIYRFRKNFYSDTTYYFLTWGGSFGKRIPVVPSSGTYQAVSSYGDFNYIYEQDLFNPVNSGLKLYDRSLEVDFQKTFSFAVPSLDASSPVYLEAAIMVRSVNAQSSVRVLVPGTFDTLLTFPQTGSQYFNPYGFEMTLARKLMVGGSPVQVQLTLNRANSSAVGHVDYILLNARQKLVYRGKEISFQDRTTRNKTVKFNIETQVPLTCWDVSDIHNVVEIVGTYSGGLFSFAWNNAMNKFILFTPSDFKDVKRGSRVDNQNLHGLAPAPNIIVSHPALLTEATRLAQWHTSNGLRTIVVTTTQCYNEFSGGSQDPMAIRLFVKMLYDRALSSGSPDVPRYLLLFGDGSFDNKNVLKLNPLNVPTYETVNSTDPVASFTSDDFYAYLDDAESDNPASLRDIAVGRIQVRSLQEAKAVVDKIMKYRDPSTWGEWIGRVCIVADDEDGNLHVTDADQVAEASLPGARAPYLLKKIYLDYYPQESGGGGNRYPLVNKEITRWVSELGTFLISYTGHGGVLGWAHERVLGIEEILSWNNTSHLPICATFTCEFTRFDNPYIVSAGDYGITSGKGGFVALVSTTRLVFASQNRALAEKFFNTLFPSWNRPVRRLGDIVLQAKNQSPSANTAKYGLFGDPALLPVIPAFTCTITSITPDTIKALTLHKVEGEVKDTAGSIIPDYNGTALALVYNVRKLLYTRANDGGNPFKFTAQNQIIYRGVIRVSNGRFSFQFIPPVDIKDERGAGSIQIIGTDPSSFAFMGMRDTVWIGGMGQNIPQDNTPPTITLFLNDTTFQSGSIVNDEPTLIAIISDEHGINLTGTTPGSFIHMYLDGQTGKYVVLNDFFRYDENSYQRGRLSYKMPRLQPGEHSLTLVAYDTYNNRGEATIYFRVVPSDSLTITNAFNFPNPFSTRTSFYFQHNQPYQPLNITINIYTISGKRIKTIRTTTITEGFVGGPITWDGTDEYGDPVARGIYIFTLSVSLNNGKQATLSGKMAKIF